MNFGNVAVKPGTGGDRDHGGGGITGRNIECWFCEGDHMKRACPKRAEDTENKKKNGEDVKNKRVEVTGGAATRNVHVIGGRTIRDRLQ